ncbi:MAG: hypothetical protein JSS73_01200 [Bacteroidetes bacterium]|nr:hypothetical protein [Bacteroidota bacterium]
MRDFIADVSLKNKSMQKMKSMKNMASKVRKNRQVPHRFPAKPLILTTHSVCVQALSL